MADLFERGQGLGEDLVDANDIGFPLALVLDLAFAPLGKAEGRLDQLGRNTGDRLAGGIDTLVGDGAQLDHRDPRLGGGLVQVGSARLGVIEDLADLVDPFSRQGLAGLRLEHGTDCIQGHALSGLDSGHLDHGKAEVALDNAHLSRGHGEGGLPGLAVNDRCAGLVGIDHRLHACGLGRHSRILALAQSVRDLACSGRVPGRDLHQGPGLGPVQGVLPEIKLLADVRLAHRHRAGELRGAEAHDAQDAELWPHEPIGIFLHESGELGLGGGLGRLHGGRPDREGRYVPGLLGEDHGQGAIGPGRSQPVHQSGGHMRLGDIVPNVPLEGGGGQVVARQRLLVEPLVEPAGHLIEEGRNPLDFPGDQAVRRLQPDLVDQGGHGLTVGQHFQDPGIKPVLHRQLIADRLPGLDFQICLRPVPFRPELGRRDGAASCVHDFVAGLGLEHVADAPDRKAEDQQPDEDGGDPGFGEDADGGEHETLPGPDNGRFVSVGIEPRRKVRQAWPRLAGDSRPALSYRPNSGT